MTDFDDIFGLFPRPRRRRSWRMSRWEEVELYASGAKRAPKGGITVAGKHYPGGRWIPGDVVAQAAPAEKARLDANEAGSNLRQQARHAERTARGPIDREALAAKLTKHLELGGQQAGWAVNKKAAAASWRVLARVHGEHALHRVEEMANLAHKALERLKPGDMHRQVLLEQLNRLHHAASVLAAQPLPPKKVAPGEVHPWAGQGEPEHGKVYNAPTDALHVDPNRFQYKLNVNDSGVTDEFSQVRTWNPDFAGVISVWKDPQDGQTYVVNGHHRHELASRLGAGNLAVRYVKAANAQEARATGALINIAEGRGTAVDAAKFMRDMGVSPGDLDKYGVSLKGKVAADAANLTRLNDRLFARVARGQTDVQQALAVARHLPDHDLQDQLFHLLEQRQEEGKDLSPRVVEEMAREMAETPTEKTTQRTLFGDLSSEESLFVPRAELKAHIRSELGREVEDWLAVANKRRAEHVSSAGNVLDPAKNKELAQTAAVLKDHYERNVNLKGPVSTAINAAAADLHKAKTRSQRDAVKRKAVEAVRNALFAATGIDNPSQRAAEGPGLFGSPEPGAAERAAPGAASAGQAAADGGGRNPEPAGLKAEPQPLQPDQKAKKPPKKPLDKGGATAAPSAPRSLADVFAGAAAFTGVPGFHAAQVAHGLPGERLERMADMDTGALDAVYNHPQRDPGIDHNEYLRRVAGAVQAFERGLKAPGDRERLRGQLAGVRQRITEGLVPALRRMAQQGIHVADYADRQVPLDKVADFYEQHAVPLIDALAREHGGGAQAQPATPHAGGGKHSPNPGEWAKAFRALDTMGDNQVALKDLRQRFPHLSDEEFKDHVRQLWQQRHLTLSALEGRHGIDPEMRKHAILSSSGQELGHASLPSHYARDESPDLYAERAPRGGATIAGKDYAGGQWIPSQEMAKASPEEKASFADKHERAKRAKAELEANNRIPRGNERPGHVKEDDWERFQARGKSAHNPAIGSEARIDHLPDAVQHAVWWLTSGTNAVLLNKALRTERELTHEQDGMHALLQHAFRTAAPLAKPVLVQRGLSIPREQVEGFLGSLKEAKGQQEPIEVPGYHSATTSGRIAEGLTGNVLLQISATHALDARRVSMLPTQDEVLLPHNARFQVHSIKQRLDNTWVVQLVQLPPGR